VTLFSALSSVTKNIGFISTASTTYEEPYTLARKFEDYIAKYGGVKLVDELRKTEASRLNSKSNSKDWYQQTPEEV
jgi:hypothetical protein